MPTAPRSLREICRAYPIGTPRATSQTSGCCNDALNNAHKDVEVPHKPKQQQVFLWKNPTGCNPRLLTGFVRSQQLLRGFPPPHKIVFLLSEWDTGHTQENRIHKFTNDTRHHNHIYNKCLIINVCLTTTKYKCIRVQTQETTTLNTKQCNGMIAGAHTAS